MGKYRTTPLQSSKLPRGIPYIIGNEAAERFSFYGMKGILTVFMTQHLMDSAGQPDLMNAEEAKTAYHLFTAAAYFFPIIGSLISDILWGKYKTIIILSLGYCVGHACLALGDTGTGTQVFEPRIWLFIGLIFIACGAGGIKPCVSAHVGDQFGQQNQHLVSKIFSWFYFSINVGAAASTLLTPVLLRDYGPWAAFGLPGVLMAIATFVFWLGRNKFVHIPPGGIKRFSNETLSREGLRAVLNLSPIFLIFIPMFWAIFDQTGSAWVLQAYKMNRHFLGIDWLPSQIQAVNPILILILIPTFIYAVYPAINKVFRITPLRRISIGFFVTVVACCCSVFIEEQITGGDVVKTSSVAAAETLQAVNLLDGDTEGPGWSSASAPSDETSEELVIRLRERTSWKINTIAIDPRTSFDGKELVMMLDHLARELKHREADARKQGLELGLSKYEQLKPRIKTLKKLVRRKAPISDLLQVAQDAIVDVGSDESILELDRYRPQQISLYAADFSANNVPDLLSRLKKEQLDLEASLEEDRGAQKETGESLMSEDARLKTVKRLAELDKWLADEDAYLREHGWMPIGSIRFDRKGGAKQATFLPIRATHVLVRIESNYGAPRVKLGEIEVHTSEPLPDQPLKGAKDVWPNVAAIGFMPIIGWQFLAYILLTAAEVMVSITSLEFAYTQAPKKMKSFVMGIYFLGVSLGNAFTAGVNYFIQNEDGTTKLEGASYYWFFTILIAITAVAFVFYAMRYKGRTFVQGEDAAEEPADA